MSFIKRKEDFTCENCGLKNIGNGFTNHCNACLYSKHVDVSPGDRLAVCGGLMKPIFVSYTNKDEYILHKCVKCGFERKNKVQEDDSIDMLTKINVLNNK